MELDKKTVDSLLALDDATLLYVINHLAGSVGIDVSSLGLKQQDILGIRKRLSELTDADIEYAKRQMDAKRHGR